jgi:PPOX class probable F420-dependent enzyme
VSVVPSGAFGERVTRRLRAERVIWLTTVAADGTPQPNPVWFLWDGADEILVYNRAEAQRLAHLAERPAVSLNLDGNGQGGDIIVVSGLARRDDAAPAPDANPDYLAKYQEAMERVSGTVEQFAEDYPVPVRIAIRRIRGH